MPKSSMVNTDISGWSDNGLSYGRVVCWDGVSQEIQDELLSMVRSLKDRYPRVSFTLQAWPLLSRRDEFQLLGSLPVPEKP